MVNSLRRILRVFHVENGISTIQSVAVTAAVVTGLFASAAVISSGSGALKGVFESGLQNQASCFIGNCNQPGSFQGGSGTVGNAQAGSQTGSTSVFASASPNTKSGLPNPFDLWDLRDLIKAAGETVAGTLGNFDIQDLNGYAHVFGKDWAVKIFDLDENARRFSMDSIDVARFEDGAANFEYELGQTTAGSLGLDAAIETGKYVWDNSPWGEHHGQGSPTGLVSSVAVDVTLDNVLRLSAAALAPGLVAGAEIALGVTAPAWVVPVAVIGLALGAKYVLDKIGITDWAKGQAKKGVDAVVNFAKGLFGR